MAARPKATKSKPAAMAALISAADMILPAAVKRVLWRGSSQNISSRVLPLYASSSGSF